MKKIKQIIANTKNEHLICINEFTEKDGEILKVEYSVYDICYLGVIEDDSDDECLIPLFRDGYCYEIYDFDSFEVVYMFQEFVEIEKIKITEDYVKAIFKDRMMIQVQGGRPI